MGSTIIQLPHGRTVDTSCTLCRGLGHCSQLNAVAGRVVVSFSSRGVNEVLGWGPGETEFKDEKPFQEISQIEHD